MIRKSKKAFMTFILAGVMTLSCGVSASAKAVKPIPSTYQTVVEVEDWGANVTKVIVSLGKPVAKGSVDKDTFKVEVSRTDERVSNLALETGERIVTNAYVSDESGNPVQRGKYATLEMKVAPNLSLGSALNYYDGRNVWIDYDCTITQVKGIKFGSGEITGIVADECVKEIREEIDDFSFSKGVYDGYEMSYAQYTPKKDKVKNPLIIWLHGGGEGGTDPTIPLAANRACSFASEETQEYFGGAYVLAPQAPTKWMEGISGSADGTSIYEDAVMELINEYIANNDDIDTNRIYVGGCSNGGYMTSILIRDYQDYFAAAFPICGAISEEFLQDDDIEKMITTPTWMALSENDPYFSESAPSYYNRAIGLGAKNLTMTLFDGVHDTTGLYFEEDGVTPYEYDPHWSWVYVYKNQCTGEVNGAETTIIEWMANQSLNK